MGATLPHVARSASGVPLRRFSALGALAAAAAALTIGSMALPGIAAVSHDPEAQVPSLAAAGPFLLTEIKEMVRGEWARAWQGLYPLHQRIAPLEVFVRCESAAPFPAPLDSMHVVRVRAAAVHVAGLSRALRGAAVSVAIKLQWGYGPRDPITFGHIFHLVPAHGGWTWILSAGRYRFYRSGGC